MKIKLSILILIIITTDALSAISLSDWTNTCFKKVPETFKEHTYDKKRNTVTSEEFESTISQFIKKFKNDASFQNKDFWVNKRIPPTWVFDPKSPEWPTNPENDPRDKEKTYPYVQKITIQSGDKICLIGDLHGSIHSLLRNLWRLLLLGHIDDNLKLSKNFYLVLTGDYTDRGVGPFETLYTLTQLKLANWDNVFLCRGNHDSMAHVAEHTFANNLLTEKIMDPPVDIKMLQSFSTLLPHALFIQTNDICILCAHGGADDSFDPKPLFELKKSTTFEHLMDNHNYVRHSGYGKNFFLWRNYENYQYLKNDQIDAIFRGHEHHYNHQGFFLLKKGSLKLSMPSMLPQPKNDPIKIFAEPFNTSYDPVFTLVSAPGNYSEVDCFVILSTSADKKDWELTPYEFTIENIPNSNIAYVSLDEDATPKLVKTTYYESPPSEFKAVSDMLLVKASKTTLTGKLLNLKDALLSLKNKLEQFKTRLEKLHSRL